MELDQHKQNIFVQHICCYLLIGIELRLLYDFVLFYETCCCIKAESNYQRPLHMDLSFLPEWCEGVLLADMFSVIGNTR